MRKGNLGNWTELLHYFSTIFDLGPYPVN